MRRERDGETCRFFLKWETAKVKNGPYLKIKNLNLGVLFKKETGKRRSNTLTQNTDSQQTPENA